jgi:hypothetical protein
MTDSKSAETTATTKAKRVEKISRVYTFADGTSGKRLKTGLVPTAFDLTWVATGESIKTVLAEVPAGSQANALAFGLVTNITNAAGGKDSTMQDLLDRREIIMGGEWAEAAGEGGPSPTLLAEAFYRAYAARGKTTYSDGTPFTIETVTARVKAYSTDQRKAAKADSHVAASYMEIELERAKERLKKAKATLKEAPQAMSEEFM